MKINEVMNLYQLHANPDKLVGGDNEKTIDMINAKVLAEKLRPIRQWAKDNGWQYEQKTAAARRLLLTTLLLRG